MHSLNKKLRLEIDSQDSEDKPTHHRAMTITDLRSPRSQKINYFEPIQPHNSEYEIPELGFGRDNQNLKNEDNASNRIGLSLKERVHSSTINQEDDHFNRSPSQDADSLLNEPQLIKTLKELKDALQVNTDNQFTIGNRNFKMDREFIAYFEERSNLHQSVRKEQNQEADDGDFYAKLIDDMARDVEIGKKPRAELPKPKQDDFIDLLDNKKILKAKYDEEVFYSKMMADLERKIDTEEKPSVEVPKVKQDDLIDLLPKSSRSQKVKARKFRRRESIEQVFDPSFPQTKRFNDTCIEFGSKIKENGDVVDIVDEYKLGQISITKDEFKDWAKTFLAVVSVQYEGDLEALEKFKTGTTDAVRFILQHFESLQVYKSQVISQSGSYVFAYQKDWTDTELCFLIFRDGVFVPAPLLSSSTQLSTVASTQEHQIKPYTPKLYFAAALFCTRECIFNIELVKYLEDKGYNCMVPQRDGFEFNRLRDKLLRENFNDPHERSKALSWVIYLLDLGKFLYESDVMIANMDEPLDPGVLVEIMVAKEMGKPVIEYRTDSRSPFGDMGEIHKGMHFFPLFPSDHFIFMPTLKIGSGSDVTGFYTALTDELDKAIQDKQVKTQVTNHSYEEMSSHAKRIVYLAKKLFDGAPEMNCEESQRRIFDNYMKMREELQSFEPKMTYRMKY